MKHASTLRLYRYWAALKGRSRAPARADLRPYLLGSAMLDLFTLRHEGFIFGYAGSRLRAGLPQKLDNRDFMTIWRLSDRPDVLRLLAGIITHCKPVLVGARHAHGAAKAEQAEILLLPTMEPSGEASIVGALAASRDWMTGSWPRAELALAAISTPEQLLDRESEPGAAQLPGFKPLRPRLLTVSQPAAERNTQPFETV